MRKYETFFIVDPDLPDEVNSSVDEKFQSIISNQGGIIISYVPWGKKKLAYPVKKRTRGLYVLTEYAGGPELVAELERNMRLDERVLKFITVKLDDQFDPDKDAPREIKSPAFDDDEDTLMRSSAIAEDEELEEDEGLGEDEYADDENA